MPHASAFFYRGLDWTRWALQAQWAIDSLGTAAADGLETRDQVMGRWSQADCDHHERGFCEVWDCYEVAMRRGVPADGGQTKDIGGDLHQLLSQARLTPLSQSQWSAVREIYAAIPYLRLFLDAEAFGLSDYDIAAMTAYVRDIGG